MEDMVKIPIQTSLSLKFEKFIFIVVNDFIITSNGG